MSQPPLGPDRLPDELQVAANQAQREVARLMVTAYTKGMRDGYDGAANIVAATAELLRRHPAAGAMGPQISALGSLADALRTSAFEVPETEKIMAAFQERRRDA